MTGQDQVAESRQSAGAASEPSVFPGRTIDWSYRVALWLLVGGATAETLFRLPAENWKN